MTAITGWSDVALRVADLQRSVEWHGRVLVPCSLVAGVHQVEMGDAAVTLRQDVHPTPRSLVEFRRDQRPPGIGEHAIGALHSSDGRNDRE